MLVIRICNVYLCKFLVVDIDAFRNCLIQAWSKQKVTSNVMTMRAALPH